MCTGLVRNEAGSAGDWAHPFRRTQAPGGIRPTQILHPGSPGRMLRLPVVASTSALDLDCRELIRSLRYSQASPAGTEEPMATE
jgi:hypothetical protein